MIYVVHWIIITQTWDFHGFPIYQAASKCHVWLLGGPEAEPSCKFTALEDQVWLSHCLFFWPWGKSPIVGEMAKHVGQPGGSSGESAGWAGLFGWRLLRQGWWKQRHHLHAARGFPDGNQDALWHYRDQTHQWQECHLQDQGQELQAAPQRKKTRFEFSIAIGDVLGIVPGFIKWQVLIFPNGHETCGLSIHHIDRTCLI